MKIVKTLYLKAPPSHVWKFLTEADRLATWFHGAEQDIVAGGAWTLVTNTLGKEGEKLCWGEVLEFSPPHRLVHTFTHQYLQGIPTTCIWELEAVDENNTILTLTHSGYDKLPDGAFTIAAEHDKGWDEHFARLRRVVG
ncbi:MAG: SRPBCC domain-containing protein [Pseudomonadota bacterium]